MIKVFGEARSGTTYLEQLLQKNGVEVLPNGCDHPSGWKHGFPVYSEGALHVLLMRDVYEWVRSMLTGFDARFRGLKQPFGNLYPDEQPHWGKWDNLLRCRFDKYESYRYFTYEHGGILLNTEYLKQNPDVITEFTDVTDVEDINRHVRLDIESKDDPDRPQLTQKQRTWIDSQIDPQLESFVNDLSYADYPTV